MILKDIFTEVRHLLREKKELYKTLNDIELIGYSNDCQEDLVKRLPKEDLLNLFKYDTLNSNIFVNDLGIGNAIILDLPTDYLRFRAIYEVTQGVNATLIDPEHAKIYQTFSYFAPTSQNPICYLYSTKIAFYPYTSNTFRLFYYKRPIVMTAIDNTPEINVECHHLFVPYLCYRILSKVGDSQATAYKNEYEAKIKGGAK